MVSVVLTMKKHPANDNSDPFSAIGLQTALIVNKLRLQAQLAKIDEKADVSGNGDADADRREKQREEQQRDYVAQRLRDLAKFERVASGIENRPARKRN